MEGINGFEVKKGMVGCREVRQQEHGGGISWSRFISILRMPAPGRQECQQQMVVFLLG